MVRAVISQRGLQGLWTRAHDLHRQTMDRRQSDVDELDRRYAGTGQAAVQGSSRVVFTKKARGWRAFPTGPDDCTL